MGKGGRAAVATNTQSSKNAEMTKTGQKYTWAEVKKHCTPDDAWVVYHNKVYDVSDW